MTPLHLLLLLLVGAAGTGVVLTRDPVKQALVAGWLGLVLTLLFVAFQAVDVALSQAAVGTVIPPLLVTLTVSKVRRTRR